MLIFRSEINWGHEPGYRILSQIDSGDPAAAEQLLPLVYGELRKLAAARWWRKSSRGRRCRRRPWYTRLICGWWTTANRKHGTAAAISSRLRRKRCAASWSKNAGRKRSLKRGGGLERAELDESRIAAPCPDEELLAVSEYSINLPRRNRWRRNWSNCDSFPD